MGIEVNIVLRKRKKITKTLFGRTKGNKSYIYVDAITRFYKENFIPPLENLIKWEIIRTIIHETLHACIYLAYFKDMLSPKNSASIFWDLVKYKKPEEKLVRELTEYYFC